MTNREKILEVIDNHSLAKALCDILPMNCEGCPVEFTEHCMDELEKWLGEEVKAKKETEE